MLSKLLVSFDRPRPRSEMRFEVDLGLTSRGKGDFVSHNVDVRPCDHFATLYRGSGVDITSRLR